jgi:Ca2+-transporting ATPase
METEFRKGLKSSEAQARLAEEGPNELGVNQRRTLFVMIAEVVREPMFVLLLGAGAIYAVMGDLHEAAILMGFVLLIMGVTVLQERRTENALEALRDLSSPRALVIRDGEPIRIPGREVVREDIIILAEGDRVPADGKVLQAHELAVDESMLTGESEAVAKFAEADGMFAGTLVVRGQGLMQASATGGRTRLGLIGKSLQDIQIEASPLRDEVGLLTRRLAVIGVCLCVVLTLIYWAIRGGWLDGILAGITLAMGILPQEFPVIMIVFLALGARRIAAQRVLTRRLNAIETLGETTVLCVDKTGTLTENRMTLASLVVAGETLDVSQISSAELPEAYHELLEFAVLASEIEPHDPMEQAFHKFAHRYLANTEHLHPDWSLAREYELSPGLLAMSHLWKGTPGERDVVAAKGAAEAIADLCHMSVEAQRTLMLQVDSLADRGQRVLGVAKAHHKADTGWPAIQHDFDFEFLGLLGLADPLRAEVPEAIAECRRAGIRVVMITGDHPRTALAIARAAGLDTARVLTGAELENVAQDDSASGISNANVFARVTPQQKLAIVDALKSHGEVVAMTGDGVNDAPALKSAHIGIAMGKRGTDVAREAASLVLLEDDFSAIVAAVRLGRRIFANLRQALVYTLAVHVPIIGLSVLPLLSGLPLVLMPIHIAFLELIIDPACSIVFEAEQGSAALMNVPPRSVHERLVSSRQILLSMLQGVLSTAVVIGFYWYLVKSGTPVEQARALAFVTLVAANAALILPCRSAGAGLKEMFVGFSLVGGVVLLCTFASLAAITLIPMLAGAFGFQPPSLLMWGLAFLCGLGALVLFEVAKLALRGWPRR